MTQTEKFITEEVLSGQEGVTGAPARAMTSVLTKLQSIKAKKQQQEREEKKKEGGGEEEEEEKKGQGVIEGKLDESNFMISQVVPIESPRKWGAGAAVALLGLPVKETAEKLCLIMQRYFAAIRPKELARCAWMKNRDQSSPNVAKVFLILVNVKLRREEKNEKMKEGRKKRKRELKKKNLQPIQKLILHKKKNR